MGLVLGVVECCIADWHFNGAQVSKGDFVVWNLAFWVATMHSVELGLGASIGTSVLFTVFRAIATKLKHKGENHHYLQ